MDSGLVFLIEGCHNDGFELVIVFYSANQQGHQNQI
jgi:hypothetical protein